MQAPAGTLTAGTWLPRRSPVPRLAPAGTLSVSSRFMMCEPETLVGPGSEEVGEDAAGQLGGGLLSLGCFLEEPQGGQGLPVYSLGVEYLGQARRQSPDLGCPPLLEQQRRFLQECQGHVVTHSP